MQMIKIIKNNSIFQLLYSKYYITQLARVCHLD